MKVSKVVLVVVALHVLVIGGIFIFEGCSRSKVQAPDMASSDDMSIPASTNAVDQATPTPTGPEAIARLTPPVNPTPVTGPEVAPVAPVGPVAPVTPARVYTVKKNDTLSRVAKAEKVSVTELAKANSLTKTAMLKIGQKLTIPSAAPAVAAATPTTTMPPTAVGAVPTPVAGSAYEVKSGDSLWKIANANHITVAALKQANSLTKDALQVGQKLTIPAAAVASTGGTMPATEPVMGASAVSNGQTVHVVNIGEYPATIAKKYGVKVDDLLKANNITDARKVRAGAKLVIPVVAAAPAAAPVTPAVTTPVTPAVPAATVSSAPIATASAH